MKTLFILSLLVLSTCLTSCSKNDDDMPPTATVEIGKVGDDLLLPNAQKIIDEMNIPGIAAISMKSGQILEKVELGNQKFDETTPILENSKWHIGSITKSMTATLTGILVDAGHLQWETTIGDITTEGYRQAYQNVTIYQLLSHTGGITTDDYPVDPADLRTVSEIRQEWAIAALNIPEENVGQFAYSNSGYVIAGVMLELIMGASWEELITTYLFQPMQMNDTGFGVPGHSGEGGQPWGHRGIGGAWTTKNPTDVASDNPAALGPGGTVHTTLEDLAKYANLHLGKTDLLKEATLKILHTEVNNSGYALGWNVTESGITHAGSNKNWFAQLFINLDSEFVNFSVTNCYDMNGAISIPGVHNMMNVMGQRYENSL